MITEADDARQYIADNAILSSFKLLGGDAGGYCDAGYGSILPSCQRSRRRIRRRRNIFSDARTMRSIGTESAMICSSSGAPRAADCRRDAP